MFLFFFCCMYACVRFVLLYVCVCACGMLCIILREKCPYSVFFPHSDWIRRDKEYQRNLMFFIWGLWDKPRISLLITLHKKWNFPLRISSVDMTKSAVFSSFGHIFEWNSLGKTSFFVHYHTIAWNLFGVVDGIILRFPTVALLCISLGKKRSNSSIIRSWNC